jgi:hypothetical protein
MVFAPSEKLYLNWQRLRTGAVPVQFSRKLKKLSRFAVQRSAPRSMSTSAECKRDYRGSQSRKMCIVQAAIIAQSPNGSGAAKYPAQLALGLLQNVEPTLGELLAGPVDVKSQHRHSGRIG